MGEYDIAVTDYNQEIQIDPNTGDAHLRRGEN